MKDVVRALEKRWVRTADGSRRRVGHKAGLVVPEDELAEENESLSLVVFTE